jgi:hypothetical protein
LLLLLLFAFHTSFFYGFWSRRPCFDFCLRLLVGPPFSVFSPSPSYFCCPLNPPLCYCLLTS